VADGRTAPRTTLVFSGSRGYHDLGTLFQALNLLLEDDSYEDYWAAASGLASRVTHARMVLEGKAALLPGPAQ
jgi:hypothetical protein